MKVTKTSQCYVDPESCAQIEMVKGGFKRYKIIKVYEKKYKIKAVYYRYGEDK